MGDQPESSKVNDTSKSLHPAYTVTNINTKVRTLDGTKVTYSSWLRLFEIQVTAFKVQDHVDGTKPPDASDERHAEWTTIDSLVLQWICSTISDELLARILPKTTTAREAWLKIQAIFINNKNARAAALQHEFSNLQLNSCSSMDTYCQKLQDLANQLEDVDHPVTESDLVLQLVRGLPKEYDVVGALINQQSPTWETARDMLHLENQRQTQTSRAASTVLAAQTERPQDNNNNGRTTGYRGRNYDPNYQANRGRGQHPRGRGRYQDQHGRGRNQSSGPSAGAQGSQFPAAHLSAQGPLTPSPQGGQFPVGPLGYIDYNELAKAMQQVHLASHDSNWYMDTGASSHLTNDPGKISSSLSSSSINSIFVGNGNSIPIKGSGHTNHPTPNRTYNLNHILLTPDIIKNLLSVRKFTIDNWTTVEFDPFGFTVKDLKTGAPLSRHNSTGDLYPFTAPAVQSAFVTSSSDQWHNRLGHPGEASLNLLRNRFSITCNKTSVSSLCHSCQVAKHKRLPFYDSTSVTFQPFDIIHCDLWTSPVPSASGFKYYMVLIDNFTHFVWVYPLKYKSDTFHTFAKFHRYIKTQFNFNIKAFQCDMGGEFDNHNFKTFASQKGFVFRFSCPQTSQQNGRAERMIRRLNDIIRTLLAHAHLPPKFWVEALHTAAYLHNILPTKRLNFATPHFALYHTHPSYDHLRVFGCACYPNTSATNPHKLSPRSLRCIFLGYPPNHRGYRCYDQSTGRVLISRHVVFDETVFPYTDPPPPHAYTFLDDQPFFPPSPIPSFVPNHQPTQRPTQPTETPPSPTTTSPTNPTLHSPPTPSPTPSPSPPSTGNPSPSPHTSPTPGPQSTPTSGPPPAAAPHPMTTRSKAGIFKPTSRFNLHTTNISPIPPNPTKARSDPNWLNAMNDEFSALQVNDTWELVPRPENQPIIRCMWLFRHKFKADGSLERYKARLVVNGKSQTVGIDCDDTFSPVVKPTTIRTVLSIAVSRSWHIHQLDVKNAFLHGDLQETVFMHQPPGFVDPQRPSHVCRLRKSLYGLKQAPRAWYMRFYHYIASHGFCRSASDNSLFIYNHGNDRAYLLLYVDDIVLTASNPKLLSDIITTLSHEFAMTDLGELHHFLGIQATRNTQGLFLSQAAYTRDILHRANMTNCKPCATPVDTDSKLSATVGSLLPDGTLYRALAGALQYLTFTRPDIQYAVQQVCLFMHAPREPHFVFMKRILRYLSGTLDYGITLVPSVTSAPNPNPNARLEPEVVTL
ncbi:hypothetical protein QVD17_06430 [Tagetes erecta]|uniref:Integrase catalytic domain-containing protein n=1 Tax=Tagetes erecta TaxID=13708 RepID=A0AAD8LK58_TARER|nr:hypothetical protein QVD17_06430 [Tagetes erecta]